MSEPNEYVTITMGDGNTVDIPKKEVPFEKTEYTSKESPSDLEAVVSTDPYDPGHASGSQNGSPSSMPDVDVTSDLAPLNETQIKQTKSVFQKWKDRAETEKKIREDFAPRRVEKWKTTVEERRIIKEKAARAAAIWIEFIKERKAAKDLIREQLMKKVRLKRQLTNKALKEGPMDQTTEALVKAESEAEQTTTAASATPEPATQPEPPESPGFGPGEDRPRKTSSPVVEHMRATVKKMGPKVVMMKRKNAPPILSLPGEERKDRKSPDRQEDEEGESKGNLSPTQVSKPTPLTSDASVGGAGGDGDGDGGGGDGGGGEEEKKDRLKPKKPREFEIGGPQKMAGRLMLACRKNDWGQVEQLLQVVRQEGIDVSLVSEGSGWSPLHYAARENRTHILETLIQIGYNVNTRAKDGTTPLHVAILYAREDTIKCILLNKADPMIAAGPKSQLPLHIVASKTASNALVPMQLILRSSPKETRTFVDGQGNIPLFIVIETQNQILARELLADFTKEQLTFTRQDTGETAVFLATRKKDLDMLRLLVDMGGDVNVQNKKGQTILHLACEFGMDSFVRFLYSAGASATYKDVDEQMPIHVATEKGWGKIVEMLIEKFKSPVHTRTKDGSTLMHIASSAGHSHISNLFIKKGVPLYMPNKRGAKAIHLASMTGNSEMVRSVLAKGEKVDARTNEGLTALHLAVQAGKPDVVEILLGHGADVHMKETKLGETALHLSARVKNGHMCADQLIKSGAPINEANEEGETAFHLAARHGNLETTLMLLMDGANYTVVNKNGENVLHIITRECHFEIAQRLIQHVNESTGKEAIQRLVNQRNKNGESAVHYAALLDSKKCKYEYEDRDLMRLLLQSGGDPMLEATDTRETAIHYCSKSGNIHALEEIICTMNAQDAITACNKQAKNGWSPLLYACYHGHPEVIKKLLAQNARVDVYDEAGRASLHLAAELGHEDVVKLLLENNAFVNVRNKNGLTPLHLAASKGYINMVKGLVKDGAIVDAMSLIKQTPLHLAAENGQLQTCQILLQLKADVNALDNMAQTPLHLAAQNDHPEVLKLFLQTKPELVSVPNKNGQTCAHIAAEKGSVAVLKELMKFNVETVKTARIKKSGNTALHLACEGGHVKVVRQLLAAGAKPNDENSDGFTALHCAAKNGHLRVLAALKGACDWKVCSRKNGFTALHIAAKFGQTDFVSEMLTQVPAGIKSERSLNDPNGDYGITPLHLAAQNGHESTVRLLMNSKGVQIDEPTAVVASTPMHYAAAGGHLLVAGLIISRSSESLKITDKNGKTCVHVAAAAGHREMVALLLGQGAEINAQDKKQWTPLHYAARYGYIDVVELLVESGADPMATSKDEKVPLCPAAQAGHVAVISYLLKKEHDTLALMEDRNFLLDLMNCAKNHENKPIRELILVSEAPIDTAVKLAKCYENMSLKDKERVKDLEAACHYCDQVAIDLLTVTATMSNPAALLRGIDHQGTEFLDVLIELERKDVVSQHAVQRYLTEVWMGRLKWKGSAFIVLFALFLICPLVWIGVSIPIGHSLGKKPIIKFTSYLTSHIFLIILMTYTALNVQLPLFEYQNLIPFWFEWLLFIWIIGICVSEVTNPSDRSGLGAIKICILTICFSAVLVHIFAAIAHLVYYTETDSFGQMSMQLYHALYIRNQLLAFALLLSFVEFLNFLTFHPLFGPWGVIIQDLIKDLLLFMAILAIFLAGFTLQVCAIYQPVYRPPSSNNGTIPEIGSVFQSPALTFEMLFYALFGLVEPDSMPPMHLNPTFSKYIMKLVFGVFMMVTVIVLINLLIAMMSNTYQRIEAQSDIEWKFGRAKLIRNMNRTMPTPSPINLFAGLPLLAIDNIQRRYQEIQQQKEMALAKQAFGHLDQQRPSLTEAKKWLNRRASRASKASRATSGNFSNFGADDMNADELKPITEVVNWPLIVQKYLESIGEIDTKVTDEETTSVAEGAADAGDAAGGE